MTKKESPPWNCSGQEFEKPADGFGVGFAGGGGWLTASRAEPGRFLWGPG